MMKVPLYEQIYTYVINEIRGGNLKPGDRVPSEKELSIQFQVSRITSKKALEKLTNDHVIERMRGKGSYVAQLIDTEHLQNLTAAGIPEGFPPAASHHIIALLLPDFAESYGLRLVKAIEQRLKEYGYAMLLCRTGGARNEEELAIESCLAVGVDGMIVFPVHGEYYNARLLRLVLDRFPLVLVDRYLKGIPACSVFTDNRQAAFTLASYLLDLGHQKIAFISPPADGTSAIEDRLQGISAAMSSRGLHFGENDCLTSLYSTLPDAFGPDNIRNDERTIQQFIKQHEEFSAFIACEYYMAQVLVQALQNMGSNVPENYSVACFDSPEDTLGGVQFTYIRQDEQAMGKTAVDLLQAQIDGKQVSLQNIIQFDLIKGKSTQALAPK